MRTLTLAAVPLVLVSTAASGHAACSPELLSHAVVARLDKSAVAELEGLLLGQLPTQIPIPAEPTTLMTCSESWGFDSTILTPRNGFVSVKIRDLSFSLDEDSVTLDAQADIMAQAGLDMQLCAMPDAVCGASLAADGISLHARLSPQVNACDVSYVVSDLLVDVDPYAVQAQLENCGLYSDVWQLAYDTWRDSIVGLVVDKLQGSLTAGAENWLASMTNELLAAGVDAGNLHFAVAAENVQITPAAIVVWLAGDVEAADGRARCLPADAHMPALAPEFSPPALSKSMLSIAVARPFVQRALDAAWYGGAFCFDSRDYDLQLGDAVASVIPDASVNFKVAALSPPALLLDTADDREISLQVDKLAAEVEIAIGAGNPTVTTAQTDATLAARLRVDPEMRALVVEPTGASAASTVVQLPESSLGFSKESLAGFIDNMVLPLFTAKLGPLPLTSAILTAAPAALSLDDVQVTQTHLRADLSLWPIDANDTTPPYTVVAVPPPWPSAAKVALTLASSDDSTPSALMRHYVHVDGQLYDTNPISGTRVVLGGLTAGRHLLRIAAVDLAGNRDPSPLRLEVEVDNSAPTLSFLDVPYGVVEDDSVALSFTVADDYTQAADIRCRYRATLVSKSGGTEQVVAEGSLGASRSFVLNDLPDSGIIRVTVYAQDSAGNEAELSHGFAVLRSPSMGCAGAPASPFGVLLLLLWRRSRR